MSESPLSARRCGILLHPTSLPGPHGLGDIGPAARSFVDFLQQAGQSIWQMLPVHPIGGGNSPYDSPSAFAGGLHLLSPDDLVYEGWLPPEALSDFPRTGEGKADFRLRVDHTRALIERALSNFETSATEEQRHLYERFLEDAGIWAHDYGLFTALKRAHGGRSFLHFPDELRSRQPAALKRAHEEFKAEVSLEVFGQFLFDHQWNRLKGYARKRGVLLLGDIPMFVAHDSADVWANQHMFHLDGRGERTVQAGVPPDYFSADGQLWGNPLYRWDVMQADGYGWFIDRLRRELKKFDAIRLDHFIAFHRYWEVPMGAQTAREGRYVHVPGADFLEKTRAALGSLPLIAEDLGIITREVEELRDRAGLPGMRILQFAFTRGAEAYLPHRHPSLCVAYTGTHDNNTTRGFFEDLQRLAREGSPAGQAAWAQEQLDRIEAYTGVTTPDQVSWAMIRALLSSQAQTAILPIQDALDLGESERMNRPGTATGNWGYRVLPGSLTPELAAKLRAVVEVTERLP